MHLMLVMLRHCSNAQIRLSKTQAACKHLQAAYFKVQYHVEIAILNHLYNLSINEQFFPYDSI